ncbi:MAG: LysM peptidoglycan-binding domain-containing protein [Chloroflexota bacterium]|nr:LysM peptidoglycan-binding domain-containing protein [Chloroflexota bacterium]
MREGHLPTRGDRAHRRYLHADARPGARSAGRGGSFLSPYMNRLIPPIFLVTVTAVVLLGGGFWSAPSHLDPVTGLPAHAGIVPGNSALPDGTVVTNATTGDVSVTVTVPDGSTTTSLASTTSDSAFIGYLPRPGTIITAIPQRVGIVPARHGDTLETIAARMSSSSTALMWANGITDPTRILPAGQTIRVPPSGTMLHRIKETDTLDSIARAYQVKVQDITTYPGNNVLLSSDLVPGAFLIIPTTNLPTRDHTVFYQVQEGDSLARISAIYALGDPLTLRWANNLPGDLIHPGQIIAVPPTDGIIHIVEPVDTQRNIDDAVTQIAKNFACAAIPCNDPPSDQRVNDLASKIFAFGGNHLTHGGKLIPGQEIVIPGGIPYVEPPPVIIPQNVALDNPNTRAGAAGDASFTTPSTTTTARSVPSGGGSSAIVRVAQRYLGAYRQPSGLPWAFWCEKFIGDVADNAGVGHYRFPTALADAYSGPINRGLAPAGTLVFFDQSWNVAGHVGIAMGDGTMISALSNGVVRTTYEGSSGYIGWRSFA